PSRSENRNRILEKNLGGKGNFRSIAGFPQQTVGCFDRGGTQVTDFRSTLLGKAEAFPSRLRHLAHESLRSLRKVDQVVDVIFPVVASGFEGALVLRRLQISDLAH